jgi:hypothetical protein
LPFNLGYIKLNIAELEYQLDFKFIYKIEWDFREKLKGSLHDVLKVILDMRLLDLVDKCEFKEYVEKLVNNIGLKIGGIKSNMERKFTKLLKNRKRFFWMRFHYTLVRAKYQDMSSLITNIVFSNIFSSMCVSD